LRSWSGQAVLRIPELDVILTRLESGIDIQREHGLRRLRELVGAAPRPAVDAAPQPVGDASAAKGPETEERVQHAKFGVGAVVRREGSGPDAKLVVRFDSGDKTLLARFLVPLPPEPG
jgi:hypothetical protein